MKRGWHKFTALFLSAMLIVGMIPLSAGATTPNGTGNQTSASQIVENGGKVIYIYYTMKAPESSDEENVEDNDTPTGPAGGENSDVNGGDTTTGDGTTSGDETISDSSTPTGSADDMNTPATGDMTNLIVPMVAVLLSGILALGMYALRHKADRS